MLKQKTEIVLGVNEWTAKCVEEMNELGIKKLSDLNKIRLSSFDCSAFLQVARK